jgi:[acyl-carrier-protein] S-malonyltransferase
MNAQPAILAVSIACLDALRERLNPLGINVLPAMVAGHSLGEFTAMVAAGALEFEEALLLVRERGRLMKESSVERPGGMAAVIGLNEQQLQAVVDESQSHGVVTMASANSPGRNGIVGRSRSIVVRHGFRQKSRGAKLVQRLAVSIASHSPLMQQASVHFSELLSQVNMRPRLCP